MLRPTLLPELSVIVPVLNEVAGIDGLFATLAAQERVAFELVVADGGSMDGTVEKVRLLSGRAPFPVSLVETAAGRARQMNAGTRASRGGTLLFLHADSSFRAPTALRSGLDLLAETISTKEDHRTAGHFRLRFARSGSAPPSLPYYFYEWKARLHRKECTYGDQGLLIRRGFFEEMGPFDESLPFLEDLRLAEKIARCGAWLLLPAEIFTSARRFETEGLRERQTVNAILMNFVAAGWEPFLRELPRFYPSHDRAGRLILFPFLRRVEAMMDALPPRERLTLWYETGRYVRANAWQIPFALDVRRHFQRRAPVGSGETPLLALHDRWFDRLTDHPPGRVMAALLTWAWFRLSLALRFPSE